MIGSVHLRTTALSLILASLASGANEVAADSFAVTGATIHPISGPVIEDGVIVVEDGVIRELGARSQITALPPDTKVIQASGRHLWPGLVDGMSYLGLREIGSVRGTVDVTEAGTMNPNARAEVAVNVSSEHFPVTRANGILLAATLPYGSLVPGMGAVIALDGWTWEEAVRRAPLGLVIEWPSMGTPGPRGHFWEEDPEGETPSWQERVESLSEMVQESLVYERARSDAPIHRDADVRWESVVPVASGEIPVWVKANRLTQIREAMAFTEEEGLSMVLVDGTGGVTGDAWRVAADLARRDIPVVVQTTRLPARRYEPYDTPYTAPAKLHAAGVRIVFGSWNSAHSRSLPQEAARAVAYGLPREAAERALTLGGAEVLGIDDRYGSLEVGKSATMILVEGDLLETRMNVEKAWLDGTPVELESRHTMLWKRWSSRPHSEASHAEPASGR